ncbi:MAG: peptidylprolyl isomerase [Nitrospirota bacterium]|nr:peptidylprolyl isomerase [Nitrospirota bacterium]
MTKLTEYGKVAKVRFLHLITGLTILMLFTASASASILLDRVVAVVDRDVITWSELYKAMEFELSGKLAGLSPEEKEEQLKRYEKDFLDMLIDTKIQLNEASRLNIGVSEKDINSAINRIRQKYGLSEKEFLKALKNEGFTLQEYKKKVTEQITLSKLVNIEIRSKIIVTEGEIEEYIKTSGDSFDLSESYRIRHIIFPAGTNEEKADARKKATEVIKLLDSGESFESVVRKFSEGSDASKGGDLGFIKKKDLAKEFLQVIEGMKVGEYSQPFWSGKGFHVIMLEGKSLPDSQAALRKKVREILIEKKLRKSLKEYLRSLRSRVFIEVKL